MMTLVYAARTADCTHVLAALRVAINHGARSLLTISAPDAYHQAIRCDAHRHGVAVKLDSRSPAELIPTSHGLLLTEHDADLARIALAAGCPVICQDAATAALIGRCGVRCDPWPTSLGSAIAWLCNHPLVHHWTSAEGPALAIVEQAPSVPPAAPIRRPIAWAQRKTVESVPPLRMWIMAAVSVVMGYGIWALSARLPWASIRSMADWLGMVMLLMGSLPLLGHAYQVLVGGAVDKVIEIASRKAA